MSNALCKIALLLIALAFPVGASAHEYHPSEDEAVNYSGWFNGLDKGCCNNQDCRPADDGDVRYSPRVEVKIEGQWCPVQPHHYLKKGAAANRNLSHVCIQILYRGDDMGTAEPLPDNPCERLLCFQPKPLF